MGTVVPLCEEELAEEGVERLLDAFGGRAAGVLLAFEGGEEPAEDEEGAFGGILFGGRCAEDGRSLGPVGGEFCG